MTGTNMISRPGYLAFAENHTFRFTCRSRCCQADPSFHRLDRTTERCQFHQFVARLPGDYFRLRPGKALRLLRSFKKQYIGPVFLSYAGFFLTGRILRQGHQLMTTTQGTDPHHRVSYTSGQCKNKALWCITKQLPHLVDSSERMCVCKFSTCFCLYRICRAWLCFFHIACFFKPLNWKIPLGSARERPTRRLRIGMFMSTIPANVAHPAVMSQVRKMRMATGHI